MAQLMREHRKKVLLPKRQGKCDIGPEDPDQAGPWQRVHPVDRHGPDFALFA